MIPQRVSVKFFAEGQIPVDLSPFIPLLHRWIQNNTVPGLLVDVAGYQHVPEGPGVLLIGHDVDYGLDLTAGKLGLLVRRKRYDASSDLAAIVRDTLHKAAVAATALHAESSPRLQLHAGIVEISLIDRLCCQNNPDSLAAATGSLEPVLRDIYPNGFECRQGSDDPRACLSLIATSTAAVDFGSMVRRLG